MKHLSYRLIEAILPYLPVFIASLFQPRDPDLGWHLKYGEYFFTHGHVLRENMFATEMPHYIWNNINWGTDMLTYMFFSLGSFFGLTIASAGIITLTFMVFARAYALSYWEKAVSFPILLYLLYPIHVNSFKGQLISLFMLSLLTYLLKRYERTSGKSLFFIPFLFLIWANLHGLFLLGLGIFLFWQAVYLFQIGIEERSIRALLPTLKRFLPITILSFFATLIHPYGIGVYQETLKYINNPLLSYVVEYSGASELSNEWYNFLIAGCIVIIACIGYTVTNQLKEKSSTISLFSLLFVLSLWVRRYSWAMYYFLLPFLRTIAGYISPDSKRGQFLGGTSIIIVTLGIVIVLKLPLSQYTSTNWQWYCESLRACSHESAEALASYYKRGETFNTYASGGYLIWNFPRLTPAVDGRMHLWKDEEGYSAFLYTYMFEWDKRSIDESKYTVAYVDKTRPVYERLKSLAKMKQWQQVYDDELMAIFIRN